MSHLGVELPVADVPLAIGRKEICEMIEKAMYIKGLCDGMELDVNTKEGKVINALVELVSEMASTIDEMKQKMSDLEDYVEEIDEDLGDVEEVLVDADSEDEDVCDGNCENCDFDCDGDDDEDGEDDSEGEYFEVVCPSCGDIINFDSSIDPENLRCPNCGEKFECIVDEDDLKAIDGAENTDRD